MQYKLYKRSTIILGIILAIDIAAIIWLFVNRDVWAAMGYKIIIIFVLAIFLLTIIYSYLDLNQDKMIIRNKVKNGNIALAKITNGTYFKIIRDARLRTKVLWKLELEVYDQDMNMIKTETIEKFAPSQTSVPRGNCFVTYDPNKPKDILVIPNVIISSIPEFAPLVEEYEKKYKPTYLNVYYNNGLLIKTYAQSIKEEKEYKKMLEENKD